MLQVNVNGDDSCRSRRLLLIYWNKDRKTKKNWKINKNVIQKQRKQMQLEMQQHKAREQTVCMRSSRTKLSSLSGINRCGNLQLDHLIELVNEFGGTPKKILCIL